MAILNIDLKSLLDIPEWEKVQDMIAEETGTAIITIDFKGYPITKHSKRTDFCTVIRENPILCKRCYRCDALAGLEAVRRNKPFIYLCHCGIVDVAVPVSVENVYLGAVMFGEFRLAATDEDSNVTRLVNETSTFDKDGGAEDRTLLDLYNQLPEMEYQQIVKIADMIDGIVQFIIKKALKNRNDALTWEWMMRTGQFTAETDMVDKGPLDWKSPNDLTGTTIPANEQNASLSALSPVYPAVSFIHDHIKENIGLKDMAELCHLSPGYFSKLFRREMGENYSDYLQRQKVIKAKKELEGTTESITQIALNLGYQDPGYFIKVFKKYEGITPSAFRKYHLQK